MYESKDVMVSHPSHYKSKNGMEVIDVIEAFKKLCGSQDFIHRHRPAGV